MQLLICEFHVSAKKGTRLVVCSSLLDRHGRIRAKRQPKYDHLPELQDTAGLGRWYPKLASFPMRNGGKVPAVALSSSTRLLLQLELRLTLLVQCRVPEQSVEALKHGERNSMEMKLASHQYEEGLFLVVQTQMILPWPFIYG